jgi:hypothetical protein
MRDVARLFVPGVRISHDLFIFRMNGKNGKINLISTTKKISEILGRKDTVHFA